LYDHLDQQLVERGDIEEIEKVVEQLDNDDAQERPEDAAAAAGEQRAPHHDRRYRSQVESLVGDRRSNPQPADQEDRRYRRKDAADAVAEENDPGDRHADQRGSMRIA